MFNFFEIFFYILAFFVLYLQIFFLIVFLENRKKIKIHKEDIILFENENDYPSVSITVPAYNEAGNDGESIIRTVESLLNLNYPKHKLNIILVDDGSTDKTFEIMNQYKNHPQIKIFTKKNGGKFTAQNLGLENSNSDFIGCLDSDSVVHKEALNRLLFYLLNDKELMAIAPTIIPFNPKNMIEKAQKIDYELQIYVKKMYGLINAIHVTPGPFSIFRKEVFEKIGPYKHAHNTEDQEIAMRMHSHQMKIEHAPDAYIYTNTPKTAKDLYKQRSRWLYGFINNSLDYKFLFFKKKYGNIGFITLPFGVLSILSVIFFIFFLIFNFIKFIYNKYLIYSAIGFDFNWKLFQTDPFFINISISLILLFVVYFFVFFSLYRGHKLLQKESKFSLLSIFYFYVIFSILSPIWLLKAIWNTLIKKETNWQKEIENRVK